jgi:two-component system chemotaxis sensor kinase CheA
MAKAIFTSIRFKTTVAISTIMALFAIMFFVNYSLTQNSIDLLRKSNQTTFPVLETLDRVLINLKEYQDTLQSVVTTNDEFALEDAEKISANITTLLVNVAQKDAGLRPQVHGLLGKFREYDLQSKAMVKKILSKEVTFSRDDPRIVDYLAIQQRTMDEISGFRDDIRQVYLREIEDIAQGAKNTNKIGIMLITTCLLLSVGILLALQNSIIKPIINLASISLDVARGNFRYAPLRTAKDEVSQLTDNFNEMIGSLEINSRTMSLIINHGRVIAECSSVPMLIKAITNALQDYCKSSMPFELLVAEDMLLRKSLNEDRYLKIQPDGQINPREWSRETEIQCRVFFEIKSHDGKRAIGYLIFPNQQIYKARKIADFVGALAINITSALASIKLENTLLLVQEQAKQIAHLLNNIQQGICTINHEFKIVGTYSPFLEEILGQKNLEGCSLFDLFFAQSTLNAEEKSILTSFLDTVLYHDIISFEMNHHLLVKELKWNQKGREATCEIDWIPLQGGDQLVEQLMLVIRDVTSLRELQQQAQSNLLELQLIENLLRIDQIRFHSLYSDLESIEISLSKMLSLDDITAFDWLGTRRDLHTVKGNLRNLGFRELSQLIHQIEEIVSEKELTPIRLKGLEPLLSDLTSNKKKLYELFFGKLMRSHSATGAYLDEDREKAIVSWLSTLGRNPNTGIRSELAPLCGILCDLLRFSSKNLENELQNTASSVNRDLRLDCCIEVKWVGAPVLFRQGAFQKLVGAFQHLVRNSIYHGLKNQTQGTIYIENLSFKSGMLKLRYQDSGQGFNLKALKNSAQKHQINDNVHDRKALNYLIFDHGLSSETTVNILAGRGLGMGAVRATCMQLGGQIEIQFRGDPQGDYQPVEFLIEIRQEQALIFPPPVLSEGEGKCA